MSLNVEKVQKDDRVIVRRNGEYLNATYLKPCYYGSGRRCKATHWVHLTSRGPASDAYSVNRARDHNLFVEGITTADAPPGASDAAANAASDAASDAAANAASDAAAVAASDVAAVATDAPLVPRPRKWRRRDASEGSAATGQPGAPQPRSAATGQPGAPQPGSAATGQPGAPQSGKLATGQPGAPRPGNAVTGQPGAPQPGNAVTGQPEAPQPGNAATGQPGAPQLSKSQRKRQRRNKAKNTARSWRGV